MEDKPYSSLKPSLDRLTLGVIRILETSPGVNEVTFVEKEPAERHSIVSWEQKNSCVLPEDLKNFYLMSDGFHMTWSVKFDDNPMPLGSMVINSISKLSRLGGSSAYALPNAPTLADLEDDMDEEGNEDQPEKPHFDSRSLIFELDPCNGNGKVCLVYKHTKPVVTPDTEIWFLDRALYWHFLTDTFTAYYRLLITHLGLPQWQYAFTSYGVSPQAKYYAVHWAEDGLRQGFPINPCSPFPGFRSQLAGVEKAIEDRNVNCKVKLPGGNQIMLMVIQSYQIS
ncbi:tubulin polyglutamylase complex subunit 2 isoform X2 [Mauremys reevesii]|uniref:tubulin polyglutamylase complex subunit 2 isoform X2 n=1 Tax=Mauremys reevesii TaxID=260615 RepID=UPI00193EDEED|nr:tubulin polyglutamylase complex subunit 2 isoform X2 [Mauremys reevesii]